LPTSCAATWGCPRGISYPGLANLPMRDRAWPPSVALRLAWGT